ncbi:MAG: sodium/sugar symporter [Gammaproteobacteria bacterium]|nr:sodium/sugar symporter [Gammaproteobacteria bacterium]MDH4253965.1 sodium/sugar symporter [Gammaproteobacteria bacterium]MDH5311768.1 sodium/sugar symporter [Gammaproteobacteria bacterium]
MHLGSLDIAVVAIYAVLLLVLAQWVSREKPGHEKVASDYFLAGRSLPWWAIGASLIAANISAEQIIGMSGSAFVMGIAIGVYEWTAAIALLIVAKWLLPVFLKHKIFTMPQFLEERYDHRVRNVMAVFWLGIYVFVNLTSILWLGSLAVNTVTGVDITTGLLALGAFAAAYSLYGGLKAVALTDIIQVALLVLGGILIAIISLNEVSGGEGVIAGFAMLVERTPERFDLIFSSDSPHYMSLPGISVLVGGMWVMHLSYWGFNQYIIQRALAAKSTREAQKGILFASALKMITPVIIVLPGIAAAVLAPDLEAPDRAYPTVMNLLPPGVLGLVFAALIAAIVSSLASMMNSISTIFTMDLYRHLRRADTSGKHLVTVGRLVSLTAIVVAMIVARPLLGNFAEAFQYIQEFTGFFTPGVCALFLLGFFWPRTTSNGALATALGSAAYSIVFKLAWPELPFIDRVGIAFLLCIATGILVSLAQKPEAHPYAIEYRTVDTSTTAGFNIGAAVILVLLGALYATWW